VPRLEFEWNDGKAAANRRKHGVSFEEASTVFSDENALFQADPDHSFEENRFILLGLSASLRVLVVGHTYRRDGDTIRLIWARRADRQEREEYFKRWKQ
jgi:hypothetical protein